MYNKVKKTVRNLAITKAVKATTLKIFPPGFEGVSLYHVGRFFIRGIFNSSIGNKASALSFNFFMALFPGLIFIITLIPYIPIHDFQNQMLQLLHEIMPKNAYEATHETFEDLIKHKQKGLLSFGFLFAIYLATNGIHSLMKGFNDSKHITEKRSPYKTRLVSLFLVVILTILLTLAISLIAFSSLGLQYLKHHHLLTGKHTLTLIIIGKWIALVALLLFTLSFLYFFGPSGEVKYRFISAGAILATLFIILYSLGFAYYVNHFGRYNKLYGSLGTMIVIMVWLNFNVFVILLGYELNISIYLAKKHKKQVS